METNAFRPSWKVAFIVALTMLALFVPLFGVGWVLRGYFSPEPPAPGRKTAEATGIRRSVERSAAQALPDEPLAEDRPVLGAREVSALRAAAEKAGAAVLEIEPGKRFLVSGPPGTLAKMAGAMGAPQPASSGDGSLFEAVVEP